ncbi:MAG TPA: ATP-binding protein [Candidatus Bathyarchaeia archaeon]|nr:ATP-binding protein [Candidatus Bathyarchaeia archaeon]
MADTLPQCEFASKNLILKLQKSLEGRVEAIPPFVDGLMSIVQSLGCAAGREREVEVALIEALANAVQHGCKNDPSKKVEVCVACDDSRGLLIVIRDPGPGFDPSSIPNPVVGQNLFSTHGRGIFLINQLVDEVHYEKGGTEIHMKIS